jgi:hypothetical protein
MRTALLCLLLSVTPATAAPAPFAKPARRNGLEQFRGVWEVAAERRAVIQITGRAAGVRHLWFSRAGHTVTVTSDSLLWHLSDQPLRADAVRTSKSGFELTDAQSGRTRRATFRREGDTLRLTVTDPERPELEFVLHRKR